MFALQAIDLTVTARIDGTAVPAIRGLSFELPPDIARYVVDKAFVALDGVSLTVAAASLGRFEVALIPETASRTTLGTKGVGAAVNLEIDPVARYVLGAADAYMTPEGVTSDELAWAYEI